MNLNRKTPGGLLQKSVSLGLGAVVLLALGELRLKPVMAQNIQDSFTDSFIGDNSDDNNVNQNTLQNQNIVSFPDRVIRPLDQPIYTPPNTENDLGFNFSAGVNTLDATNVTLYFGLIFQPGRTASHKARMAHLREQTALLELEKKTMEGKLRLLETQIEEAELRLQGLRDAP